MLAIYWSLKVFRNYIYGQKFKIITDHQPLTFSLSSKNANTKLKRWKSYLEEHDYEMVYTPCKNNVVADALSRVQIFSLTSTEHSAEEDSSDMIECTEAPLNAFKLQIVLEKDANEDTLVSYPFPGFKKVIIRMNNFTEQSLTDIIRKYFISNKLTGLNCSEEILGKF